MNMNKVFRLTMILIIAISIVLSSSYCYASGIIDNPETYEPKPIQSRELTDRAGIIVGIIKAVGIVVSVISLMFIGIKTMTGSLEQKSHYKQALPGYIIGVIMVVAITLLPTIIYEIVKDW